MGMVSFMPMESPLEHTDGRTNTTLVLYRLRWDTKKANRQDCVRNGHDPNASKTHCKSGHAFTPENTYLLGNSRSCRVCQRERSRRYKERTSRKILLPATVLYEPEEGE